jgi:exopolysaccharide biosynthesis protein|tara:strand:- start:21 stop:338 length:318 start_codon:yes stop_codon:yes gene_type:complete
MTKININGINRDMTSEEQAEYDARKVTITEEQMKLQAIKDMRKVRLEDTDWMSNSDVTMPDYIKTWRQTLRDLPQNNTSESQYDTLLAKDSDGKFTNSVWTQPTS